MKKILAVFLLTSLIVLAAAVPAWACAPPSSGQGSSNVQNGYDPSDPCTWPTDIRPANCSPSSPK